MRDERLRDTVAWQFPWRQVLPLPPQVNRRPGLTGEQERILDLLCEHGELEVGEIATALNVSSRFIGEWAAPLVAARYITRSRHGRQGAPMYHITDAGRRAAVQPNPEVWGPTGFSRRALAYIRRNSTI